MRNCEVYMSAPLDSLQVHVGHSEGSISIYENRKSVWVCNLSLHKATPGERKMSKCSKSKEILSLILSNIKWMPNDFKIKGNVWTLWLTATSATLQGLGSNGKWQARSHNAQAATGDEGPRPEFTEFEMNECFYFTDLVDTRKWVTK